MTAALTRTAQRWRAGGEEAVATLRDHPRHLVLAALVTGLLARGLQPEAVVVLAIGAAALAGRAGVAALALAAVLAGAIGADARLRTLDRTALPPLFGTTVVAEAVPLEQPRPVLHGATVLVRLRTLTVERTVATGGAGSVEAPGAGAAGSAAGDAAGLGQGGFAERYAIPAATGERVMVRIRSRTPWPDVATGEIVRLRGRLRALGPFERHYGRKGAHGAVTLDQAVATGLRRGGLWRLVDDVRGAAEEALSTGLPEPQAALLRGMALGQDEALDARTRDEFRTSGLSHLTAASGQNVALLLALALPLLTFAGLGLRARLAAGLALIALYVPLAGGGPSIQRAGVMGAATTVAAIAGRPASRWYALLLAAAVTLLWSPRIASDPGWQLSFAAVVAIALATRRLSDRLRSRRVPAAVADAVAMSLAATIGTAPLLAFHFEQFSVVSLPANLLVAPAVAPVMWLGMLAGAIGQLAPILALPLNVVNGFLLGYVGAVARVAAGLPFASTTVMVPGVRALLAVYLSLACTVALALRRWSLPSWVWRNAPMIPGVAASAKATASEAPTSRTR